MPNPWNISRFEDVLGQEPHRTLLKEVFDVLIQRLGVAVADLGRNTAGDATALSARRKAEKGAQEEVDEGLPQASGGRKEYKDDEGKVTKVIEWFGFKLHLIVDVKHEVVFWGVDDGNLTGSRRFVAQVGVVLAVHAVFATLLAKAPRREGTLGKLGLSPIAEALRAHEKSQAQAVAV